MRQQFALLRGCMKLRTFSLAVIAYLVFTGYAMAINLDEGFDKGALPAGQISVDTTNFSRNLNSNDSNVQHALNTLDQLAGGCGISEAPNDTHYYGRHALGWSNLDALYLTIHAVEPIASFTIDGNGQAISVTTPWNEKVIPYACTVTAWYLDADMSGNIKIKVQTSMVSPYTSYSDIAGSDEPLLSSAQSNGNATLSAWTTAITSGTRIRVVIDNTVTPTVKKAVLTLYGTRT
jgi:hypothetical protein